MKYYLQLLDLLLCLIQILIVWRCVIKKSSYQKKKLTLLKAVTCISSIRYPPIACESFHNSLKSYFNRAHKFMQLLPCHLLFSRVRLNFFVVVFLKFSERQRTFARFHFFFSDKLVLPADFHLA